MAVWRAMVRHRVIKWEQSKWRLAMVSKPKLSDYRRWKTKLEMEPYLLSRDTTARRVLKA